MLDDEWPQDQPVLADKRHRLGAVLVDDVIDFLYTHDFGDNWRHTVTVEQLLEPDDRTNTWPICLAGENACPPRKTSAASVATWNSWRPSATLFTKSMPPCGGGAAAPSTPVVST